MRSALWSLATNMILKQPRFNVLFVTNRCNLDCKMCFYTKREKRPELTLDEIRLLAKSLPPQWYVMFTGGETFLRNDIADIAKAFYDNGAINLHFSTNATLYDRTLKAVSEIAAYAKKSMVIVIASIDGPPALHDGIRGQNGAFEKTSKTIRALLELKKQYPNIGVGTNFTLSSFNQDYWKETIDYMRDDLNVDTINIGLARGETKEKEAKEYKIEHYWNAQRYLARTNRREYFSPPARALALFKDIAQIETIYKVVTDKPPAYYQCLAGRVFSVITETGVVYPCEMIPMPMGNLRDYAMNYKKLWKSPAAQRIRDHVKTRVCMQGCTYECAMTASLATELSTVGQFVDFLFHYKKKTKEYYHV